MPSKKRSARVKQPPASAAPPVPQQKHSVKRPAAKKTAAPAATAAPSAGGGFPIIGIGASAGGLEALEEFFSQVPADTGMGFVVITHQHPSHTSLLPELLGKHASIEVRQAEDGTKIEPDHVYVSPPGGHLAILHGTLHRMDTEKENSPHLPIDYFFRSLAADQKDNAICIILSGTGTDGTLGLRAIKGESGMAMVQHVQSAKYAGMPSSAVATGLADFVLPAREMPKQLIAYARGPYLKSVRSEDAPSVSTEPMQKIFVLLRTRTGHDFSCYKANTIRRRIERRMSLHQIKDAGQYVHYLEENPHEIDTLFKELLISVTQFFRDPEAFEALAKTALPQMIDTCADDYTFRIWVPGCATGEEVYSLAILMRECLEASKRPCDVQIFGTDLDSEAIASARTGQYPAGISSDVPPNRLDRFFGHDDNTYRVRKDLREMAIFAVQNVIKDPPFTKLDIISCRNLLIYMNSDLQRRLLPIFHYALKPGGLLFLGSSESIGGFTDLFEVVDKRWKIYRRKEGAPAARKLVDFPVRPAVAEVDPRARVATRPLPESGLTSIVDHLLLARFAPACVVVSERGDVIYIHGRTGLYLEPAAGHPRLNILDMAREGLSLELGSALRQAVKEGAEVTREGVRVRTNGDFTHVNLSVAKIREPEGLRGFFLVTFRPSPEKVAPPSSKGRGRGKREASRIEELEREVQRTKASLQTAIEELETSNEELKSANEELQSTNEEMQSTNEEMETSKEEMQSLNEELSTVNTEMESKVEDLSRTNDDMQNLLNSTNVATLFLDSELNIKRYTEPAKQLVNLIQSDIGRPLAHLASSLKYEHLVADSRDVLRTLACKVAEVQTRDGHWYLMRITPYRTSENVIDGVVVTFVDINPVKAAERSLLRMSKVFIEGPEPMMILDLSGQILDLNAEAVRTYGWSRQEMIGQPFQITVPKPRHETAEHGLQRCLAGETVRDLDCSCVTKAGRELPGVFTFHLLTDDLGEADAICLLVKHPTP